MPRWALIGSTGLYPASRRVENLCHHALGQEQKQKWAKMRCWHCQSNQMTGQAHDALGKHHAGSVWVVLPTYNEADNLPLMIEAVLSLPGGFDILVVDDNSSDGTGEVADRLAQANPCVHVLHRTGKMGLGTAYLAGMRCAIEAGAQTAITMDADLSHDPGLLPQMARLAERFDIVVGSRLAKGGGLEGLSRFRRLFSIAANAYLRLVLRVPCSDFTSGYRAYGARAMRALAAEGITGKGHAVLPELLFRALRRGLTMTEIPIRFRRRHAGRSKVGLRAIFESLILPWRVRFSVR